MRLLITGVPGCGKTVLARKMSEILNANLIDVNAIIEKHKIYTTSGRKEKLVNVEKLETILKKLLSKEKNFIAESHLLCEMRGLPCDRIIVLRCNPLVLKKRLRKRGYPAWKIKENVVAELLDYCSIKTEGNYAKSKVLEIDFTIPLSPKKVLGKSEGDRVDWMREFAKVGRNTKGFWE